MTFLYYLFIKLSYKGKKMHNLVAFYESITNGSTYTEVDGVLDQSMTLDGANRFIMPSNSRWRPLGAYASGINLTAARISAPSLREVALPEIYPGNDTADVPTIDQIVQFYGYGKPFKANEPVIIEVSRGGADAQPVVCALWLAPEFKPAVRGDAFTMTFTSTNVIVAGSWSLSALTAVQTLPAGTYEIVGMACLCNDAFFCRLVFPGQGQYRPGVLVQDAYGDLILNDPFRMGRFGSFGRFVNTALPAIEVIGDAAGSEPVVIYLDLVRVSESQIGTPQMNA